MNEKQIAEAMVLADLYAAETEVDGISRGNGSEHSKARREHLQNYLRSLCQQGKFKRGDRVRKRGCARNGWRRESILGSRGLNMDSYQPIYDAVRSRISNGDIGHAVECAIREANLSHYVAMAAESAREAAAEHCRPSVLFKPAIFIDGDQWCALYGDDIQCGVAGFGNSPADAMFDFDRQWATKLQRTKGADFRSENDIKTAEAGG